MRLVVITDEDGDKFAFRPFDIVTIAAGSGAHEGKTQVGVMRGGTNGVDIVVAMPFDDFLECLRVNAYAEVNVVN